MGSSKLQALQQELLIGAEVLITLSSGEVKKGVLQSISVNHIEITQDGSPANILLESIVTWKVAPEEQPNTETPAHTILSSMPDSKNEDLLRWKLANAYLHTNAFTNAPQYRRMLEISPKPLAPLRQQGQHQEAQSLLAHVLDASFDKTMNDLLEKIRQTRAEESLLESEPLDFTLTTEASSISTSGAVTKFRQFFLQRANLSMVVPAERLQDGQYVSDNKNAVVSDVRAAANYAKARTNNSAARAAYYLIAARILVETDGDQDQIHTYLCPFFASKGDASIENNLHFDTARQFYLEAAIVYGQLSEKASEKVMGDERDAVNVVVRYLDAIFDTKSDVPFADHASIKDALQDLMAHHPNINRSFQYVVELVIHSRFAERHILERLYSEHTFRKRTIDYFHQQGITAKKKEKTTRKGFIELWNRYQKAYFDRQRSHLIILRSLMHFELNPRWLKDSLSKVSALVESKHWVFKLDYERLRRLSALLNTVLSILDSNSYEIQAYRIETALKETDDLLKGIETSPTKLCIEEILPLLSNISHKIEAYRTQRYEQSKPQISFRLAEDFDTLIPAGDLVDVQMVINNKPDCSSAEQFCLMIAPENAIDTNRYPYAKTILRGGQQDIMVLPMQVEDTALAKGAFSFSVHAVYKTVMGEQQKTLPVSFQINIGQQNDFSEITNPYSVGAIVQNPNMVYGRKNLIKMIVHELSDRVHVRQGKSYIIYGQKRTGKSTVLYYLGAQLAQAPGNLVLDLGNIGEILSEDQVSLYVKFLWKILSTLKKSLGQNTPTHMCFPANSAEFFSHASPITAFTEILEAFLAYQKTLPATQTQRIILLIDEFTYLYQGIKTGAIPKDLMTNWKAFLQADYFDAVLVGQDFMPKFIREFENQFAAMQIRKVTYLEPADATKLIEAPILIDQKSRYREQAIARILELTAGSPYYIQLFCKRLVEYLNIKKAPLITEATVSDVEALLMDELDVGRFDNLYHSEDGSSDTLSADEALRVLHQVAVNSRIGPCPRSAIIIDDLDNGDRALQTLVEREVIEKDRDRPDFFQIKVGLFKQWLVTNGI